MGTENILPVKSYESDVVNSCKFCNRVDITEKTQKLKSSNQNLSLSELPKIMNSSRGGEEQFKAETCNNMDERLNKKSSTKRERRPDRPVYIPKARRSQTTPPSTTTSTSNAASQDFHQPQPQQQPQQSSIDITSCNEKPMNTSNDGLNNKQKKKVKAHLHNSRNNPTNAGRKKAVKKPTNQRTDGHNAEGDLLKQPVHHDVGENKSPSNNIAYQFENVSPLRTECNTNHKNYILPEVNGGSKAKKDDDGGSEVSENFAHLKINDMVPECYYTKQYIEKDLGPKDSVGKADILDNADNMDAILPRGNTCAIVPASKTVTDSKADADDWENLYNDNGECIQPKSPKKSAEKMCIAPPVNCDAYAARFKPMKLEEYPHVLEISNFPVEFKTQDLIMLFAKYKESGFDIKWVDDTHALAVFSSSTIAAEVLALRHPFVVLKPLTEASYRSKIKAKKFGSSLDPYRPRPETCAALARRLVSGALGVRLKLSAAEREMEKRILDRAKGTSDNHPHSLQTFTIDRFNLERKQLALKQQKEAWGN